MHAHFIKILSELKASRKVYPILYKIMWILKSHFQKNYTLVATIVCMNIKKLTYDELRGDLITFKKVYLNKCCLKDNKKISCCIQFHWWNFKWGNEFGEEVVVITK